MKDIIILIVMTAVICMGGAAIGAVITSFIKRDAEKTLGAFLGFAAGLTLSIVCFDLIPECIEGFESSIGIFGVILCVCLGYGAIRLIDHLMHGKEENEDENCCHCHCHEEESGKKLFTAGMTMAFAISLHNLPVGMIIGSTFASSKSSALLLALAIALHNVPEGMAISVPLISGGAKKRNAILITSLTGVATVIGAILGFSIGSIAPIILAIALGLAAGTMLYVSTAELLPEAISTCHPKLASLTAVVGILVALVIIFA